LRKPAASPQRFLKIGGEKACTIETIRHAPALIPASDENGMQLNWLRAPSLLSVPDQRLRAS
jgi:hypothetical protein